MRNLIFLLTILAVFFNAGNSQAVKRLDWAQVDEATEALMTIAFEHHEIHEGDSFTMHFENDVTNIGEMTVIAFSLPDTTQWAHCVGVAESILDASTYMIVEAPSIDQDEGTDLVVYNRNRNSSETFIGISIEAAPNAKATSFNETQAASANITTTIQLLNETIGQTGNVLSRAGGTSRAQNEFIFDQGGEYAYILTATTANDTTHSISVNCYQHTNNN